MEQKVKLIGSNVTVMVSSMAKAISFYTETLGLALIVRHSSHWAEVGAPGITIGLHPKGKNKGITTGDNISIGFQVGNLEEAVKLLDSRISFEVKKDSQVHLANFTDLDGNALYFYQLRADT